MLKTITRTILSCLLFCIPVFLFGQENSIRSKIIVKVNNKGDTVSKKVEKYNKSGFMVKRKILNKNGVLKRYSVHVMDKENNVKIDSNFNEDGVPTSVWTAHFNEHGDIIRKTRINPQKNEKHVDVNRITYNDAGKPIKIAQLREDSTEGWIRTFRYNNEGKKTRYFLKFMNRTREKRVYKYNEQGKKSEEIHYTISSDTARKGRHMRFKYNNRGNLIRKTIRLYKGKVTPQTKKVVRFKYNARNLLKSKRLKEDGALQYKKFYRYRYYE